MGKVKINKIIIVLRVLFICLCGFSCVVFCDLCLDVFNQDYINKFRNIIRAFVLCAVCFLCTYGICQIFQQSKLIYKLLVIIIVFLSLALIGFYFFKSSELFKKIKTVEDLRVFINGFYKNASLIYIIIQFLQVVVLPLPSIIVTGAGVLLFGPFKCAILSCIGIICGSVVSFFFGRIFGYKFVRWFLGKDNVEKWLSRIEGKDKILLSFMFLFPFFPDDMLCMLSGVTGIKVKDFMIIVFFTRIISITVSCYSLNNDIIPLNTWWGILLVVLFFVLATFVFCFILKKEKLKKH